jgi:phage FluMu gp28-like protein
VRDLGQVVLDAKTKLSAHALHFASGRRIYSLSSNSNALAGKRSHVKLDEFALHQDQRLLNNTQDFRFYIRQLFN